VLPAGKAVDQNAFAVSKDFAAQHHLKTLSDPGAAISRSNWRQVTNAPAWCCSPRSKGL
jgi:glycine betaine/choline ABC-type transport system substrate-binding protein